MKRIYHPHTQWEDLGMWFKKKFSLQKAIDFTGDADLYGSWMLEVLLHWHKACEHNLTAPGNRRAWLGHAACYLAIGCPESVTREAWGHLSDEQREAADQQAQDCIDFWEWQHHGRGCNPIFGPYIDSYISKGYSEIPDELPLDLLQLAPAYKFICRAILRNDLHLTTLGYSRPKSQFYSLLKRIEINERTRSNA